MSRIFNIWSSLLDLAAPRACLACGRRLSISEQVLCATCNLNLPRTNYHQSPYDNELAKCFWGLVPIERCSAYFFYLHHTRSSALIYSLKYDNKPYVGVILGRMIAEEYAKAQFFEGVNAIVPVPISKERQRERGYNQSEEIAKGISEITGLPILSKVISRQSFVKSQTRLDRWEREENVKDAFFLLDEAAIRGKHLLIVDDVITTGATIRAASEVLLKVKGVKISVFSLAFARN